MSKCSFKNRLLLEAIQSENQVSQGQLVVTTAFKQVLLGSRHCGPNFLQVINQWDKHGPFNVGFIRRSLKQKWIDLFNKFEDLRGVVISEKLACVLFYFCLVDAAHFVKLILIIVDRYYKNRAVKRCHLKFNYLLSFKAKQQTHH